MDRAYGAATGIGFLGIFRAHADEINFIPTKWSGPTALQRELGFWEFFGPTRTK
jgi:hypothetical protein